MQPRGRRLRRRMRRRNALRSMSLEATQFGCNVINIGRDILMGAVETDLAKRLMAKGFDVRELPLSEFQRGRVSQGSGTAF